MTPRSLTHLTWIRRSWAVYLLALGVLFSAMFLATACERRVVQPITTPDQGQTETRTLLAEADQAWQAENFYQSQALYDRLLNTGRLAGADLELALERFVLSAIENRDFASALGAIHDWSQASSQGRDNRVWQDAYITAIKGLSDPYERETGLTRLATDPVWPWRLKALAQLALAGMYWNSGDIHRVLDMLDQVWAQAANSQQKADVEEGLLREAMYVDNDNLEAIGLLIPAEDQTSFPYTVIQLEMVRRQAVTGGDWAEAWQTIQTLRQYMANSRLIDELLASLEGERGQPVNGVVLALPLTGQYATFGWKVVRGAGTAQWQLVQDGMDFAVEVVNTESPDWIDALGAMPESYMIVGGPLRANKFEELRSSGLLSRQVYFSFLRNVEGVTEGQSVWRFFPSREDQVRSLLDLANGTYGFTSMGVMFPDDNFGRGMATLFQQECHSRGVVVAGAQSYPADDHTTWGDAVGDFIRGGAFEAIFLPGDWAHAEMIVPYILYYDARGTLVMGPALWGQSLSRRGFVAESDFEHAVFPGTWDPENNATGTHGLHAGLENQGLSAPDFWVALGYDFVRFANQLGSIEPGWNSRDVNARLQNAQHMDWAMAPMTWDEQGRASQKLFLLRPGSGGFRQIDEDALRTRLR